MTYQERTYHGICRDDSDGYTARILVEKPEEGPTERKRTTSYGELSRPPYDDFGWGYNGTGTSKAAIAILSDALELSASQREGIRLGNTDRVLAELREDFCEDVLGQFCQEWRLRRGAVLRWARGWYEQHGMNQMPALVARLPEVEQWHAGRSR